jgi:hypothetical protein
MDVLERFASEENVWRFIDRLAQELMLARLLLEEEDKFAKEVDRFEATQYWINRCDGYIDHHSALLEGASDANRARIQRTIHTIQEIKRTLDSLRMAWRIRMDEAAKFVEKASPPDC